MIMIDHVMVWFEMFEIPTYNHDEVTDGNDEYIYKKSTNVSQFFKNTRIRIYLRTCKVIFDKWIFF